MLITEVVSRSICELVFDIHDRKVSKLGLPMKVGTIASVATAAANKLSFGPASAPIAKDAVKDRIIKSCFPPTPQTDAQSNSQGSSNSSNQ